MKSLNSIAVAASLALVGACGTDHNVDQGQVEGTADHGGSTDTGSGSGSGSGSSAAACPLGVAAFSSVLGPSQPAQLISLAVDAMGNVFAAGSLAAGASPSLGVFTGVAELSASGQASLTLPYGSLVA